MANTKAGGGLSGVPLSGRCLVRSPEVFGSSPENPYTLCEVFSYWVAILNALNSKEALSRQSLQKYSEDLQVQNLKIFFNSANRGNLSLCSPVSGRMPQLDCVSNIYQHVWLAGVCPLEPLSGVSSQSLD